LAALVAFAAATGSPIDADKLPDRPVIVQPVPASAPVRNGLPAASKLNATQDDSTKSNSINKVEDVELKGTIQKVSGNTITVNGQSITIAPSTKVEGKLEVGATVRVEGMNQNGSFVAKEVNVTLTSTGAKSSDDKSKKTDVTIKPSDDKKKIDATIKPSDDKKLEDQSKHDSKDDSKKDDKSGKSGSDDSKKDDKSGSSDKSGSDKSGSSDKDGSGHH
jgi:hypothetical protein